MQLPRLDYQAHFWAGIALSALAMPFGLVYAVLVPAVIGMGKEIADPYLKGHRDWMDFVWTVAGMVVYVGWVSLIN